MYLNEQMDAGDIITQKEVEIGEDETTGELWNRLSLIGAELLLKSVREIERGIIKRIPQGEDYTLAPMLDRELSKIDWQSKDSQEIKNLVRGLNPIMGAYTFFNGKKIKFWKVQKMSFEEFKKEFENVQYNNIENSQNGEVILSNEKLGLFIKTRNGIVSVLEIQGENAKRMGIKDFLRGNKIKAGEIFL